MLKKFSGSILYILISLLVISLYLDRHESLEKIEMSIQDTMLKFRGKKDVTQDIVIVGIDDLSLRSGGKWPWNRDKIARLIDGISAQKPQTIALDMNFVADDYQKAAGFDDSRAALSRALATSSWDTLIPNPMPLLALFCHRDSSTALTGDSMTPPCSQSIRRWWL